MSINKHQLRDIVEDTLLEIGFFSPSAVELVLGTIAVESRGGEYIKQIDGPALGIVQMEPATHRDIWKNYLKYNNSLAMRILVASGLPTPLNLDVYENEASLLLFNLKYAIAMCRVHYLRVPYALPDADDLQGLAHYWKTHYNTHLGAGTVQKFEEAYKELVI